MKNFKRFQDKVTIKFVMDDPTKIFTHSFNVNNTIEDVKQVLVSNFNIPYGNIGIYKDTAELRDRDILEDFEIDDYGMLQLTALSKDVAKPLTVDSAYEDYVIPDIITVKLGDGDDARETVVEIENRTIVQQRLGGYKNKMTSKNV